MPRDAAEQLHRIAMLLDDAAQRLDDLTARDPDMADAINAIPGQDKLELIAKRLRDAAHRIAREKVEA